MGSDWGQSNSQLGGGVQHNKNKEQRTIFSFLLSRLGLHIRFLSSDLKIPSPFTRHAHTSLRLVVSTNITPTHLYCLRFACLIDIYITYRKSRSAAQDFQRFYGHDDLLSLPLFLYLYLNYYHTVTQRLIHAPVAYALSQSRGAHTFNLFFYLLLSIHFYLSRGFQAAQSAFVLQRYTKY